MRHARGRLAWGATPRPCRRQEGGLSRAATPPVRGSRGQSPPQEGWKGAQPPPGGCGGSLPRKRAPKMDNSSPPSGAQTGALPSCSPYFPFPLGRGPRLLRGGSGDTSPHSGGQGAEPPSGGLEGGTAPSRGARGRPPPQRVLRTDNSPPAARQANNVGLPYTSGASRPSAGTKPPPLPQARRRLVLCGHAPPFGGPGGRAPLRGVGRGRSPFPGGAGEASPATSSKNGQLPPAARRADNVGLPYTPACFRLAAVWCFPLLP